MGWGKLTLGHRACLLEFTSPWLCFRLQLRRIPKLVVVMIDWVTNTQENP